MNVADNTAGLSVLRVGAALLVPLALTGCYGDDSQPDHAGLTDLNATDVIVTQHVGVPGEVDVEVTFANETATHQIETIDFDGDGFDWLAEHEFTELPADHYQSQGITLFGLDARSVGTTSWAHSPPIGVWQAGFSEPPAPYAFEFDPPVASVGLFANDVEGGVDITVLLEDGTTEGFQFGRVGGAEVTSFHGYTATANAIRAVEFRSYDYHIIDDLQFGRIESTCLD